MEMIAFTTKVLGPAAFRLEQHKVTQTLRSENSSLTIAILNGRIGAGDRLSIVLDSIMIGDVELLSMNAVTWEALDIDDAHRGGFDSLDDLATALKKDGYRFLPMNDYHLFRIQFSWLDIEPKVAESRGRAVVSSPGS